MPLCNLPKLIRTAYVRLKIAKAIYINLTITLHALKDLLTVRVNSQSHVLSDVVLVKKLNDTVANIDIVPLRIDLQ